MRAPYSFKLYQACVFSRLRSGALKLCVRHVLAGSVARRRSLRERVPVPVTATARAARTVTGTRHWHRARVTFQVQRSAQARTRQCPVLQARPLAVQVQASSPAGQRQRTAAPPRSVLRQRRRSRAWYEPTRAAPVLVTCAAQSKPRSRSPGTRCTAKAVDSAASACVSAYAQRVRCLVLRMRMVLRASYAMPGTEAVYGATRRSLGPGVLAHSTLLPRCRPTSSLCRVRDPDRDLLLCAYYVVSGTELGSVLRSGTRAASESRPGPGAWSRLWARGVQW
eukprot:1980877-Rhodomonas_salina.2